MSATTPIKPAVKPIAGIETIKPDTTDSTPLLSTSSRGDVTIRLDDIGGFTLITPRTARQPISPANTSVPTVSSTATTSAVAANATTSLVTTRVANTPNNSSATHSTPLLLSAAAPSATEPALQKLQAEHKQELEDFANKHNINSNPEYKQQLSRLQTIHLLELNLLKNHGSNILQKIENGLVDDPKAEISIAIKITADKIDLICLNGYLSAREKAVDLESKSYALNAIKPTTMLKSSSNTADNVADPAKGYNAAQQDKLRTILDLPKKVELEVKTIETLKIALGKSLTTSVELLLRYQERHLFSTNPFAPSGERLKNILDSIDAEITCLLNDVPIKNCTSKFSAFDHAMSKIRSGKMEPSHNK